MRGILPHSLLVAVCGLASLPAAGARGACPENMADVLGRFCIDRYEGSLVSIDVRGKTIGKHSPFHPVLPKARVRAESRRGAWPQGYISMRNAHDACAAAGKRLCKDDAVTFGWERMNDPRLNQVPGSLARTGSHKKCRNALGVYDMVGNLHEWTADPEGTFRGGFYLDNTTHGLGCRYLTTGHSASYHDYSTGFRCCADRGGQGKR